jgi:hypothetical protein
MNSKAIPTTGKPVKESHRDAGQAELFGIIWRPFVHEFRLRAGDVIRYGDRLCVVLRVNDCAAVVLMNRPPREFVTRFDKRVRLQPKPAVFRISPTSQVEILNRKKPRAS